MFWFIYPVNFFFHFQINAYALSINKTSNKIENLSILDDTKTASLALDHVDDLPTTTRRQKAFSWVMVLLIIIAIAGVGGFFYYQKVQRESQKRFY